MRDVWQEGQFQQVGGVVEEVVLEFSVAEFGVKGQFAKGPVLREDFEAQFFVDEEEGGD